MKILLDACVPRPLRKFLHEHLVNTAQEMGWGHLKNGALLKEAENQFGSLITTDQNLKYQQKSLDEGSLFWFYLQMIGQPFGPTGRKLLPR